MVGDLHIVNFKRKLANRLFVLVLMALIVGAPIYGSMVATIGIYYGTEYISVTPVAIKEGTSAFSGMYIWEAFFPLVKYGIDNIVYLSENDTTLLMKLLGPITAGVLSALVLLFLLRAPLLDWRPFRMKESIHGDAKWADEVEIKRAKLRAKKRTAAWGDEKGLPDRR